MAQLASSSKHDGATLIKFGQRDVLRPRKLPVVLQSDLAECGLACLAMVAMYMGIPDADLPALRRRFRPSPRGMTLRNLIVVADAIGLLCHPVRIDLDGLLNLRAPAILHWQGGHYVVLLSVSQDDGVTVHDPATGVRDYSMSDAAQLFGGIALILNPKPSVSTTRRYQTYGHTIRHLSQILSTTPKVGLTFVKLLLYSVALQVAILGLPVFLQFVIDRVLMVGGNTSVLIATSIGLLGLAMFSAALVVLQGRTSLNLVARILNSVGVRLMSHLLRLPTAYFESRSVGDLISRFQSLHPVRQFLSHGTVTAIIDGVMSVGLIAMMLFYAPSLALVVFVSILCFVAIWVQQLNAIRWATASLVGAQARGDTFLAETLSGMKSLRLGGREADRERRWSEVFGEAVRNGTRVGELKIRQEAIKRIQIGVEYAVMIYFAAIKIPTDDFTIGMLYAFILYRVRLVDSIYSLVERYLEYRIVDFHLNRLTDILGREEQTSNVNVLFQMMGAIEVRRLQFSYSGVGEEDQIFKDLSFVIPSGSLFALFGPSGVGKSTLLNVLAGFLEPTDGAILIDGRLITHVTLRTFRKNTAAVLQDDLIFEGTVMENITFFESTPDENAALLAARAAHIDEEIMKWPLGYSTVLGGARPALSAGQRQRILIARAFYKRPALLILDEATSSCDGELQARIFDNIRRRGVTCIYATHDERLLEYAEGAVRWNQSGEVAVVYSRAKDGVTP